jgi:hypothetical protein
VNVYQPAKNWSAVPPRCAVTIGWLTPANVEALDECLWLGTAALADAGTANPAIAAPAMTPAAILRMPTDMSIPPTHGETVPPIYVEGGSWHAVDTRALANATKLDLRASCMSSEFADAE